MEHVGNRRCSAKNRPTWWGHEAWTALGQKAKEAGSLDLVNASGKTALMLACSSGNLEFAECLLRAGAGSPTTDDNGNDNANDDSDDDVDVDGAGGDDSTRRRHAVAARDDGTALTSTALSTDGDDSTRRRRRRRWAH